MAVPERKGRSGAWLVAGVVVALLAVAALVACVVVVDGRRRQQLADLEDRLDTLGRLVDEMQRQLDRHANASHQIQHSGEGKGPQQEVIYEDQYEYDDEEEGDSYEYDEEGGDVASHKSTVRRTPVLSEDISNNNRSRRDISAVLEESQPVEDSVQPPEVKSPRRHPNAHQPHTPVYQNQRRPEESFVRLRHGGRSKSRNTRLGDVEFLPGVREELDGGPELTDGDDHQQHRYNIIAAHFVGDVSAYNSRVHSHYYGNHIMHHPSGIFKDWVPASWMFELGTKSHFTVHHGKLSVEKPGIYFIYAQIYYMAMHDRCGFHIKHNGEEVAQCMITSIGGMFKRNTCFTALVLQLQTSDLLWTSEIEGHRNTSFKSSHSFFGLILLKPS